MNVRIGCSGWNYAHWRNGVFYPPRCPSRFWLDYYARFFETVEVNATFYRLPTAKAVQGWVDQSPDNFLFTVKMSRYVATAFEFRHESWFADDVMQLLRQHGVALVIGDRPEVHAFQTHELTADWTFVRFHAGSRGARGNYSENELREWAERLRAWPVREAFVYFNNDWKGFAIRNALRLKELLEAILPA